MSKPVIGITPGDPGGIGPEIIIKTLKRLRPPLSFSPVLFGTPGVFPARFIKTGGIEFFDVSAGAGRLYSSSGQAPRDIRIVSGKVARSNACIAYASIKSATEFARAGKIQALVTAPVHKTAMRLVDPGFCGHTEFLAGAAGVRKFAMMFVSPRLKVTLATIHVPVRSVSKLIRKSLVYDKIELTNRFLKEKCRISRPRIAVCALNPHGRETGEEDEREIRPAVEKARRARIQAEGPLPGDQVFYDAYHGRYDAVISMFHDQGLAPFKMIAFRDGVNVTLGLPYVRTSPDHGTAFDIAGQGKADPASFEAALGLAVELTQRKVKSKR